MPKDTITAMLTRTPSVEKLPSPSSISFPNLPGVRGEVIQHAGAIANYFRGLYFAKGDESLNGTLIAMQKLATDPLAPLDPEYLELITQTILLFDLYFHDDTIIDVLDYEIDQNRNPLLPPKGLVSTFTVFDSKMSWTQIPLYRVGKGPFHRAAGLFLTIVNYLHDLNQERGPGLNAVILQANQLTPSPKGKSVHDAVLENFRADEESRQGLIAAHKYFTELFFSNDGKNNFYPLFQLFVQGGEADPKSQETRDKIQANIQDLHTFFEDLALFIDLTKAKSLSPVQLRELRTKYPNAYTRAEETQHRLFSRASSEHSLTSKDSQEKHTDQDQTTSLSEHSRLSTKSFHSGSDISSLSSGSNYTDDPASSRSSSQESLSSDNSYDENLSWYSALTSHPPKQDETTSTSVNSSTSSKTSLPSTHQTPSKNHPLRWLLGQKYSTAQGAHAASSPSAKNTWARTAKYFLDWLLLYPIKALIRIVGSLFNAKAWGATLWTNKKPRSSLQKKDSPEPHSAPNASPQKTVQKGLSKSHSAPTSWSRFRLSQQDPEQALKKSMDLSIRPWQEKKTINQPNRVGFRKIQPPKKNYSDPAPSNKK